MNTSRNPTTLSDPNVGLPISQSDLAYVRTRNRLTAFKAVREEFRRSNLSQSQLAERLKMDAGRLSRLLSAPGNWTMDTMADLMWAISGARIKYSVEYPLQKPQRNATKPDWSEPLYMHAETTSSRTVRVRDEQVYAL